MQIKTISYRLHAAHETIEWQLQQGQSKTKSIVQVYSTAAQAEQMIEALREVFFGSPRSRFGFLQLRCIDNDGNHWQITRNDSATAEILRNGQKLGTAQEGPCFAEIFEQQFYPELNFEVPSTWASTYLVQHENKEFRLLPFDGKSMQTPQAAIVATRAQKDLAQECAQLFQQQQLGQPQQLTRLCQKLEPLYFQITELWRQKRQLDNTIEKTGSLLHLRELEQVVEVLKEVEQETLPLVEPSKSQTVLNQKWARLEIKEHALAPQFHGRLPEVEDQKAWSEILSCRAYLDSIQHLKKSVQASQELHEQSIDIAFQQSITTLRCLVEKSHGLTEELETGLNQVRHQISTNEALQAEQRRGSLVGKLGQFLKPASAAELDQQKPPQPSAIDNMRTTIDFVLSKMGEMHSLLNSSQEEFYSLKDDYQKRIDWVEKKALAIEKNWQELCLRYAISQSSSYSSLVQLMQHSTEVSAIHQERHQIRNELNLRNQRILKLEKLIVRYREIIGSQKDFAMTTPEMVISEAQAILRHKAHRHNQLEKMKSQAKEIEIADSQMRFVQKRLQALLDQWNQAFAQMVIHPIGVNNLNWLTVFQKAHTIRALVEVAGRCQRSLPFASLWEDRDLERPVVFLRIGEELDTLQSNQLVDSLGQTQPTSLHFVLHEQPTLADAFEGASLSRLDLHKHRHDNPLQPIVAPTLAARTPSKTVPVRKTKQQKAQEVMNLFEDLRIKRHQILLGSKDR